MAAFSNFPVIGSIGKSFLSRNLKLLGWYLHFRFLLGVSDEVLRLTLKIRDQLLNNGIPSLFSFQRISVESYRQFVLARIIVVIDLWLFGHLFAPPAARS